MKSVIDNWNINTASWLKNSVYIRTVKNGGKPGPFSVIATYTVSAIWHGFYGGYYCKSSHFFIFFLLHLYLTLQ